MKRFIILLFGIVSSIMINAQVEVSTSQLAGIKWKRNSPLAKGDSITMVFTETEFTDTIYYSLLDKTSYRALNYYITDELQSYNTFHMDYVGKERKGRYIVLYYPKVNDVDYYTVTSFTDDELVLFHKARPESMPSIDVYVRYERIKE